MIGVGIAWASILSVNPYIGDRISPMKMGIA
jgi:hypothetical protein